MNEDLWLELDKYSDAKEIAEQHWSYVKKVILNHVPDMDEKLLEQFGFHYKTAMIHGFGHGYEDAIKDIKNNS